MSATLPPFPAPKPRPRAWWFVIGTLLVILGVGAGIALFAWTLLGFVETDARVPADGQAHQVEVGTDGERMLWLQQGYAQECSVVDTATGGEVQMQPVDGNYSRSENAYTWIGATRFDPGSGNLEVTCESVGSLPSVVLIGPAPQVGSFVVGILATVFVPLILGGAGLAILIATGILYAVRPKRA